MRTAITLDQTIQAEVSESNVFLAAGRAKVAAYLELTKPRIATMVLITVATGFLVGIRDQSDMARMVLTMIGTGLVAGGASALNQLIERDRDALMRRTKMRPLPTRRLGNTEAAVFGTGISIFGLLILFTAANSVAAAMALATLLLYVFVYTPLKSVTTLNTAIGAVPGALPPVIGWAAATGRLGIEAWALFLILFLWQFPHFLAIAWIYREDYARGGHKMLPIVDPTGKITGRQAAFHALALVPVGLLPATVGLAGRYYFAGALVLGLCYLVSSIRFWFDVSDASARRLLRTSILYLPAILGLLLLPSFLTILNLNPMPE